MLLSFQQPAVQSLWNHLGQLRFSSAGIAQSFGEGAPPLAFHDHPQLLRPFFDATRSLESSLKVEDTTGDRFIAYSRNGLVAHDENGEAIAEAVVSTFLHLRGTFPSFSPWGTNYSFHELALPNEPVCTHLQTGSRDRNSELVVSQNVAMSPSDHYQLEIFLKAETLRAALQALGHDVFDDEPLWRTALGFSHALACGHRALFADGFMLDGLGSAGERHQSPLDVQKLDALFSGGTSVFPARRTIDVERKWTIRTAGNPYFVQNEQTPLFAVETDGGNVNLRFLRTRKTPLAAGFARLFDFLLEHQGPEARRG